jgi:hypothetical protein
MDPFHQFPAARRHFSFQQVDEVTGLQAAARGNPISPLSSSLGSPDC